MRAEDIGQVWASSSSPMVTQARSPLRVTSHLPDYAYTEFSLILSP